jgi:predicted ribosomally synthesized peptide with nif11-like leader
VSVENLKEYVKLCAENEEVRKKAKEIGMKDLDGHVAHGKSLGLEFSKEDLAALAKEAGLNGKNELSEEELKKVAGGLGTITLTLLVLGFIGAIAGGAVGAGAVEGKKW